VAAAVPRSLFGAEPSARLRSEAPAVDLARDGTLDEAVVLIDRMIAATITDLRWVRAAADGASAGLLLSRTH
jgi:hypothetical protein